MSRYAYLPKPALGLGDTVLYIPFFRALTAYDKIFMATPWPELFHSITRVVPMDPRETASKSHLGWFYIKDAIALADAQQRYRKVADTPELASADLLEGGHGPSYLSRLLNVKLTEEQERDLNWKPKPEWLDNAVAWLEVTLGPRPWVLIHPPVNPSGITLARDPVPQYFADVKNRLNAAASFYDVVYKNEAHRGVFTTSSVIDLGVPTYRSTAKTFATFLGLIAAADAVVCSDGHMMHLAMALQKPMLVLFGGRMRPDVMVHKALRYPAFHAVAPDPFCDCGNAFHACPKAIPAKKLLAEADALISGLPDFRS